MSFFPSIFKQWEIDREIEKYNREEDKLEKQFKDRKITELNTNFREREQGEIRLTYAQKEKIAKQEEDDKLRKEIMDKNKREHADRKRINRETIEKKEILTKLIENLQNKLIEVNDLLFLSKHYNTVYNFKSNIISYFKSQLNLLDTKTLEQINNDIKKYTDLLYNLNEIIPIIEYDPVNYLLGNKTILIEVFNNVRIDTDFLTKIKDDTFILSTKGDKYEYINDKRLRKIRDNSRLERKRVSESRIQEAQPRRRETVVSPYKRASVGGNLEGLYNKYYLSLDLKQ